MIKSSKKDWKEDFQYENGKYLCHCAICGSNFLGHKRRVICKECSAKQSKKMRKILDEMLENTLNDNRRLLDNTVIEKNIKIYFKK